MYHCFVPRYAQLQHAVLTGGSGHYAMCSYNIASDILYSLEKNVYT